MVPHGLCASADCAAISVICASKHAVLATFASTIKRGHSSLPTLTFCLSNFAFLLVGFSTFHYHFI